MANARIHAEALSPSGVKREADGAVQEASRVVASIQPATVPFMRSAKEAHWTPDSGALFELADLRGLTPEYGCRVGGASCGGHPALAATPGRVRRKSGVAGITPVYLEGGAIAGYGCDQRDPAPTASQFAMAIVQRY